MTDPTRHVVLGTTASGKHSLAMGLARELGAEIVVCDSMKVYRGLNIGTAKPTAEQQEEIPHHGIDICDPWDSFSASQYREIAWDVIQEIEGRGNPVVIAGGSSLYLKAVVEGLFEGPGRDPGLREKLNRVFDEEGPDALHARLANVDPPTAERLHPNDRNRVVRALEVFKLTGTPISQQQREFGQPDISFRILLLLRDRDDLHRRVESRVDNMLDAGWLDEVKRLWTDPRGLSLEASRAHGYPELKAYLDGNMTWKDAREKTIHHVRQYVRHQTTWFKHFAHTHEIHAKPSDTSESVLPDALEWAHAAAVD